MNILLCCAAGMSTSLLVTKMEKYAAEQGIACRIWAVSGNVVKSHAQEADVILVGPQVRYLLPELKKYCEQLGIPCEVINMLHYGTCNGAEVFKQAEQLIAR